VRPEAEAGPQEQEADVKCSYMYYLIVDIRSICLAMIGRFFQFLDVISPAFALVFYAFAARRVQADVRRNDIPVVLFLAAQLCLNLAANILQLNKINNQFLYQVNCLVSFAAIALFFFNLFPGKATFRKAIAITSVFFGVFFTVNLLFVQTYLQFPGNSYSVCVMISTIFSLMFFRTCLRDFSEYDIFELREVWYSCAILVYFASSFFVFISYSYLFSYFHIKSIPHIWKMHNVFMAFMCILMCKGFLCRHSIREYL
jgi:hypothetical protein